MRIFQSTNRSGAEATAAQVAARSHDFLVYVDWKIRTPAPAAINGTPAYRVTAQRPAAAAPNSRGAVLRVTMCSCKRPVEASRRKMNSGSLSTIVCRKTMGQDDAKSSAAPQPRVALPVRRRTNSATSKVFSPNSATESHRAAASTSPPTIPAAPNTSG
jgi:hypothetical protein